MPSHCKRSRAHLEGQRDLLSMNISKEAGHLLIGILISMTKGIIGDHWIRDIFYLKLQREITPDDFRSALTDERSRL